MIDLKDDLPTFVPPTAEAVLKKLLKCNVHTHLEGSVRTETLWQMTQDQGIDLKIHQ